MTEKGILDGLVVLDLSRLIAGPYCTMLMADMGATVYKIEMPGKGDDGRATPPFVNGESAYYFNFNRGKIGCTLNLKAEEGKNLLKEMVKKADILIENFRPGTMEKLRLGYDVLKEVNPRLIYGAVSGYGAMGPYAQRPGYDLISQALSGIMSVTGWPDGDPTRTGAPVGDILGGLNCCIGVLAALHHRTMTGEGQKVEIGLVDSVISALTSINMSYLANGTVPCRNGNVYKAFSPYELFRTKDGSIVIAAANDKLFGCLAKAMGQPELTEDKRFLTNMLRVENEPALKEIIENWTKQLTTAEAFEKINAAGVPVGPVNTIDQVVNDPHFGEAREMFPELEHPVTGKLRVTNSALKFSDLKAFPRAAAPLLGEHNETVYKGFLGLSDEEYEELRSRGIL